MEAGCGNSAWKVGLLVRIGLGSTDPEGLAALWYCHTGVLPSNMDVGFPNG